MLEEYIFAGFVMIIWFSQMKICLNSFVRNTIDYSMETKVMLSWGGVKLTLLCEKLKVILFSRGDSIMLYSFFLNQGFVPLSFPGKVFNEATLIIIIVYSFSFTEFLSQWVFLSKVLMRHNNICYGHPRGSVMNIVIIWMSIPPQTLGFSFSQ